MPSTLRTAVSQTKGLRLSGRLCGPCPSCVASGRNTVTDDADAFLSLLFCSTVWRFDLGAGYFGTYCGTIFWLPLPSFPLHSGICRSPCLLYFLCLSLTRFSPPNFCRQASPLLSLVARLSGQSASCDGSRASRDCAVVRTSD